jgi:hypothetical protein
VASELLLSTSVVPSVASVVPAAVVAAEVADVSADVVTVGDADAVTESADSGPSSPQLAATSAAAIRSINVFGRWREKRASWVLVMVSQVLPRSA